MSWPPQSLAAREGWTSPRLVRCVCGVRTWAIDLLDVTPLPESARGSATHWCGGCRERAFAEGRITRAAYFMALGAPTALIAQGEADDATQAALAS